MEHYQGQHGNATRVDEYGNPVSQTEQYGNPGSQTTDQYGNPVHHNGGDKGITEKIKEKIPGAGGGHGQGGYGTTTGTTTGHHGCQDEVDEHGVRRNKGITEKIKENIPGVGGGGGHAGHGQGGHGYDQSHTTSTTTPAGGYQTAATGEHGEKKGIMDKIKEKLPGKN